MANPTLSRSAHETATRRPDRLTSLLAAGTLATEGQPTPGGRRRRTRTQVRAQWLVLAAALTVLAGVLVAWAVQRAADRVEVVSVARPVAAGAVITADDLTTTAIAFDTPVTGLAPASSLDALVGRVATVDLEPGVLLSTSMWADGTELSAGERTVGALLDAGTFPAGLAPGSTALAVALGDDTADAGTDAGTDVTVRVLDAADDDRGALRVTLAVPEADAARIARLAAADRLVLVGVPAVATPDEADPTAGQSTPQEAP
ncbi:MAG: SAF domain-containing protein [Acidimicrobiales bacterium]